MTKGEGELLLSPLYTALVETEEALPRVVYNYTSDEDFKKIDNVPELQMVYWGEMVQRLHTCCATSIMRLRKWYDAMEAAYGSHNYYGFCSSIRGLIEACSDSFYALGRVILPMSDIFKHIRISLEGKAQKVVLGEDLENELIHYVFGRKLGRSEKQGLPESHNAKQVRVYLDAIKESSVDELYSELCQVSHPSTMSLLPFLMNDKEYGLILHKQDIDEELNKNLLKRHRLAIHKATAYALSTSLSGLRLINALDIPFVKSLKTDEKLFQVLQEDELWKSVKESIDSSLSV